jgi:iron complex transport system substrate-binding protein
MCVPRCSVARAALAGVIFALLLSLPTIADASPDAPLANPGSARIVSLSPALTEMLFAIGAGDRVVGVTSFCNYPAEASELPKIGGFSERSMSLEAIVALSPTIVIGQASAHESIAASLESARIRTVLFEAGGFDQVIANIERLGDLTARADDAASVVRDIRERTERIVSIVSSIPEAARVRVFWETWDDPLMTAGPNTFTGDVIRLAGGVNIFADVEQAWPVVSHEEVLRRNPEAILASVTHDEKLTPELLAGRPGWSDIVAVRQQRIHLFDGDIVSRPGPRVIDALELMAAALYPDHFR